MGVDVILAAPTGVTVNLEPSGVVVVAPGPGVEVIATQGGPPGAPASQDVGLTMSGVFSPGERINMPRLPHPAVYNTLWAHTDSGVFAPQTVTIQQISDGVVVATADLSLTPDTRDFEQTITALSFAAGDYPSLVFPTPADSQLIDLTFSLGSTP